MTEITYTKDCLKIKDVTRTFKYGLTIYCRVQGVLSVSWQFSPQSRFNIPGAKIINASWDAITETAKTTQEMPDGTIITKTFTFQQLLDGINAPEEEDNRRRGNH